MKKVAKMLFGAIVLMLAFSAPSHAQSQCTPEQTNKFFRGIWKVHVGMSHWDVIDLLGQPHDRRSYTSRYVSAFTWYYACDDGSIVIRFGKGGKVTDITRHRH